MRKSNIGRKNNGRTKTREYKVWLGMKARCYYKSNAAFCNYGLRGITLCDRWKHGFAAFLADMGPRPGPQYTIERKDNNGPYAPDNCIWIPKGDQQKNTRRNHLITYNGETKPKSIWAEEYGLKYFTLNFRLREGWSIERALTTPCIPAGQHL